MRMCIDHYPPYHILNGNGREPTGALVDIAKAIAQRLDLDLVFTGNTPFLRCLRMMNDGSADIMMSLLDKSDRREYMYLFRYMDNSNKAFYGLKRRNLDINSYKDLKGLSVGVARGYKYFPEFDKEKTFFRKDEASSVTNNFKRLIADRVDVVIATQIEGDYLIQRSPQFLRHIAPVSYQYVDPNPVYIGLSKKSVHAYRAREIEKIVSTMRKENEFTRIIDSFIN